MDRMVYREIENGERISEAEFAALLAQLDDTHAASIDDGFQQLCRNLDELRRRDERKSN